MFMEPNRVMLEKMLKEPYTAILDDNWFMDNKTTPFLKFIISYQHLNYSKLHDLVYSL